MVDVARAVETEESWYKVPGPVVWRRSGPELLSRPGFTVGAAWRGRGQDGGSVWAPPHTCCQMRAGWPPRLPVARASSTALVAQETTTELVALLALWLAQCFLIPTHPAKERLPRRGQRTFCLSANAYLFILCRSR